jgi:hypothetical protein
MPGNILYAPYAPLVLTELQRLTEENPPENDRYVSAERRISAENRGGYCRITRLRHMSGTGRGAVLFQRRLPAITARRRSCHADGVYRWKTAASPNHRVS